MDDGLEALCLQSHTASDRSSPATVERAIAALDLGEPQLELIRQQAAELAQRMGAPEATGGGEEA